MPRALKVYFARLGFFESVVAAPSQAAALRAWGVHQNLFESGDAELTDDPDAFRAALAHPGAPLKRPVGGRGAFALEAEPPDAPAPTHRSDGGDTRPPSRPDRSALAAAEARLERIEDEQARGEAEFFRRREGLEAEEASARKRWAAACKAAQADVQHERRAFAKAGGHP